MTLEEKYEAVCASLVKANSLAERFERKRSNVEGFTYVGVIEEDYSDGANPYRVAWDWNTSPYSAGTKLYVKG